LSDFPSPLEKVFKVLKVHKVKKNCSTKFISLSDFPSPLEKVCKVYKVHKVKKIVTQNLFRCLVIISKLSLPLDSSDGFINLPSREGIKGCVESEEKTF
jgi:hypothetical protein